MDSSVSPVASNSRISCSALSSIREAWSRSRETGGAEPQMVSNVSSRNFANHALRPLVPVDSLAGPDAATTRASSC